MLAPDPTFTWGLTLSNVASISKIAAPANDPKQKSTGPQADPNMNIIPASTELQMPGTQRRHKSSDDSYP
jgi:hypothetical protein